MAFAQTTQPPPEAQLLPSWIWDIVKTGGPLVTGGLAGAFLTYFLNQRSARRKQAKLLVTTQRVDYSIAARDQQLKDLRVSFRGQGFDNLLLYQVAIENVSNKTVPNSVLLIQFNKETSIIDRSIVTRPIARDTGFKHQTSSDNAYLWEVGELKPRDSASLKLLLAPTTPIEWGWRGDDDVEVTSYGREAPQAVERELRNLIFWAALFLLIGSVPFFGDLMRGFFLVILAPYIASYVMKWLPLISRSKMPTVNIDVIRDSKVALAFDGAEASIGGDVIQRPPEASNTLELEAGAPVGGTALPRPTEKLAKADAHNAKR
jgi:hypothetical protein